MGAAVKKLPVDIKEKWCEALTSGKYNQGHYALRTPYGPTGFCCLGVLCDVLGADWTQTRQQKSYPGQSDVPEEVYEVLIQPFDEDIPGKSVQNVLATMNDRGKSFKDIVRVIREKL
jgi:hypothetical protein